MKNPFTVTASCVVILSLYLAALAIAQNSVPSAGHGALIQERLVVQISLATSSQEAGRKAAETQRP